MWDSLHMAGQSEAKAHSETHDPRDRRPPGRRRRVVGFGVLFAALWPAMCLSLIHI